MKRPTITKVVPPTFDISIELSAGDAAKLHALLGWTAGHDLQELFEELDAFLEVEDVPTVKISNTDLLPTGVAV